MCTWYDYTMSSRFSNMTFVRSSLVSLWKDTFWISITSFRGKVYVSLAVLQGNMPNEALMIKLLRDWGIE